MAEQPRTYQILETLAARLRTISIANGFLTDAGRDVRTEETKSPPADAPRITLYAGTRTRPDDARSKGERDFTLIAEARVPVGLENIQALTCAIDEDMERALDQYLQQPLALPLVFEESIILDRPDGLAEQVIQQMYTTRYRR